MLEMVTGPVTVTGYRSWEENGEVKTRRDGSKIEFVLYRAEGDPEDRETVLDASVNGGRVEPGTVCALRLVSELKAEAMNRRDGGRPFVVHRAKLRVIGFGTQKS